MAIANLKLYLARSRHSRHDRHFDAGSYQASTVPRRTGGARLGSRSHRWSRLLFRSCLDCTTIEVVSRSCPGAGLEQSRCMAYPDQPPVGRWDLSMGITRHLSDGSGLRWPAECCANSRAGNVEGSTISRALPSSQNPRRKLLRAATTFERRRRFRLQRPAGAGTRSPLGVVDTAPGAGIASQRGAPPASLQSSMNPVAVLRRHADGPELPLATPSCHSCDGSGTGAVSAFADEK